MSTPRPRDTAVLIGTIAVVVALVLTSAMLASCRRGIADPVADGADGAASMSASTLPVVRRVAAPEAGPAQPVADPRCRAARRLFLRAAIDSSPAGSIDVEETRRLLDMVKVLASGSVRADLDAVRDLGRQLDRRPGSATLAQTESATARMERLLVWTVTACPPPQRPVWGCATPITFGRPDLFDGPFFLAAGQLVPDEAVTDRLGEIEGRRIELARDQNQVIFAWVDVFGLVRSRVRVVRVFDLWFVVDARHCEGPLPTAHPLDTGAVIVEELPDVGDGPQYAPTTTTTTIAPTSVPGGTTTTTIQPVSEPCGYDPDDDTDAYDSLGHYMATGPAEADCWNRLTAQGRACVREVTASAPAGDPSADDLFACFDL